eukprot:m.136590 g.136590  ORF g.136590 m.136590 type:complete len:194 (-) comp10772_c0_seq1:2686-3267(-)
MPHTGMTDVLPLGKDTFYLFSGSEFSGTQRSSQTLFPLKASFNVVDFSTNTLCGVLEIQNLTPQLEKLQTFFDVEVVTCAEEFETTKYTSSYKEDIDHWKELPGFKMAFLKPSGTFDYKKYRYIFMRWKEHYQVPQEEEQNMEGASFEGFYYVCFDRIEGTFEGFYFHDASERFQRIHLENKALKRYSNFEML